MSKSKEVLFARYFEECKILAQKKIKECFHPECNENSINTHILQRNGILSAIAEDSHIIELHINQFKNPTFFFKKIGLKDAFSFKCFCNKHDTELFQTIESGDIDFTNYKNKLLFALRTIYNEKYRKMVNIDMYKCLLAKKDLTINTSKINQLIEEENLGLRDLEKVESLIWKDLTGSTESFIFRMRCTDLKEACLSSFYNYETSEELLTYFRLNGKQKDDVINIFVNLFPYKNGSIFMMGYRKCDTNEVEKYIDSFFTVNEKELETKITNLMMFQCETWVISNSLYKKRILGNDIFFHEAVTFSLSNPNERRFFEINLFSKDFKNQFESFRKKYLKR